MGAGLVVAAVEETGAVAAPAYARELHPLERVGGRLAAIDVKHMPFFPVRAGGRQAVGEIFAVLADRITLQGYGAVGRERVRIEQHARRGIERIGDVEHGLILQAVVARVEIFAAAQLRWAVTLEIPQLGQTLPEPVATGDLREIGGRKPVLGLDPGMCVRRVDCFQPAIGIGDLGAVVVVGLRSFFRLGIGQRGRRIRRMCRAHGLRGQTRNDQDGACERKKCRTHSKLRRQIFGSERAGRCPARQTTVGCGKINRR